MKFKLIIVAMVCFAGASFASEVTVSVNPNPLFVGERGQYQIVSTRGQPILKSFPKVEGIDWDKDSRSVNTSVSVVNSNMTTLHTVSYTFTVKTPGSYLIPGANIQVGNRVVKSNSIKMIAQERQYKDRNNTLTLNDLIYLKISYDDVDTPPEKIYIGQEITLTIKLYVSHRLEIYSDKFNQSRSFTNPNNYFPNLNLDNVVYRDYSEQNQYNNKFLYNDSQSEIIDGNRFHVFTYQTSISGIEVGTIKGSIDHTVPIIDPNRQRQRRRDSFDDFFGFSGFSRRAQIFTHQVEATIPPISVVSIPSDDSGSGHYLGLIGSWDVELLVGRPTIPVGEDTTLTLNVRGTGNIAPLSSPKLKIPGFRIYPPEITRNASAEAHGMIKWVIVPLNTSSQLPKMIFKTFNPESGTFEVHEFEPTLTVKEAEAKPKTGPVIEDYASQSDQEMGSSREVHRATDILYIKKELGSNIKMPLWQNVTVLVSGLVIIGPVCYLAILFLTLHNEKLQGSLTYKRRREALRKRRHVLRTIKNSSQETLPGVIREELIPFLQAIFSLPPGATSTELLEKINDKELTEILTQAETGGFMPGKTTQIDPHTLLKKVKNLFIFVALFLIPYIGNCEDLFTQAGRFYDQGKIEEAEKVFLDLLLKNSANATLLFNLGNCAYRKGDFGNALAYYERARRLKPRDSDIIENLNFVRSQLNLAPILTKDTPLSLLATLRDQFRPDEWLIYAAVAWCLIWIFMAINRLRPISLTTMSIIITLVLAVSIGSYIMQKGSSYAKNQAIVIAKNTPIFRLPQQAGDGKAKFTLTIGDYVAVVEKRSEWSRIRIDQDEGWIKNDALKLFW